MVYKIVYKSVAALLAIAMIPIVIFTPMFHVVGDITISKYYIGEDVSFYDIYELFLKKDAGMKIETSGNMSDAVKATIPWLITSGVILGALLLLGIATAVVVCLTKKKTAVFIMEGASMLLVLGLFKSFNAFAAPYVNGTIRLSDLGLVKEGIFSLIFSSLFRLEILQLSTAGFLTGILCIAAFLWTGAFMLVEMGENEPKKKVK